jgi:hypothetical protein
MLLHGTKVGKSLRREGGKHTNSRNKEDILFCQQTVAFDEENINNEESTVGLVIFYLQSIFFLVGNTSSPPVNPN